MKRLTLLAALFAVTTAAFTACDKDDVQPRTEREAISFRSRIDEGDNVRAAGAAWHESDEIGIYMIPAGESDLANQIEGNKKHVTSDVAGNFEAATGHELYFPLQGDVDFIAYYPYNDAIGADNIFPVSVLDQEESAEIDLMYAETNVGHNADGDSPTLMFTHKLSRLLFEIEDTNGKSLDGITARITGLHTEGEFDLSTGALTLEDGSDATPIAIRTVSVTGSTAVLEAIVLPDATAMFDIEFTVPGSEPMTRSGVAANFAEGTTYTWEVNMTDEDLGDVGSMILMGAANISDWTEGTRDNFDLSREPGEVTPPPAGDWTAVFSDDFSILSEGDNTTSTGANSGWAGDVNWIVESAYSAGGMVKLGTGTKVGSITSKSLDFAGATTVKVTVSVKGWSSVEGTLNVTVGSETQNIAYTETQSAATPGTYSIEFTAPSGTGTVRLATSAKRAYIDEVVIEKK